MIAEKLERQIEHLQELAARGNGDLEQRVGPVLDSMRLEVERVKGLELAAVLPAGEDCHAGC